MKTFKQNCFEAYTDSDLNEGKGHKVTIGYFTNQADAYKAVQGKGVMGSDGNVSSHVIDIKIFENYEEYIVVSDEKIKQIALGKLSEVEKKVLGLI